ncbi:hypothetical protein CTheo_8136 [Ceratobasidium theobromae]|uniref:Uncharacterized protein n=1 Tax=Ceratobasidium theobromae TaxID=1582974 RepID=A0A5N5QA98_9AGAM|nr:hypothetical protein CTheo_8136 [Ceratobasidium theobromae]
MFSPQNATIPSGIPDDFERDFWSSSLYQAPMPENSHFLLADTEARHTISDSGLVAPTFIHSIQSSPLGEREPSSLHETSEQVRMTVATSNPAARTLGPRSAIARINSTSTNEASGARWIDENQYSVGGAAEPPLGDFHGVSSLNYEGAGTCLSGKVKETTTEEDRVREQDVASVPTRRS